MDEKSPQSPPAKLPESEEEQEKVIKLLEERLEKHDNDRKIVQGKLTEILNKLTEQVDGLEDRASKRLEEKFSSEEDRLQAVLNELCENSTINALQEAKRELTVVHSYDIIKNKKASNDLSTFYGLKTERRTVPEDDHAGFAISGENSSIHGPSNTIEKGETPCNSDKFSEERERFIKLLEERLKTYDDNRKATQDKLHEICERLRTQIDGLEERINKELKERFIHEDDRLQAALNRLRINRTSGMLQKAKNDLLVKQSYELIENKEAKHDLTTLYKLKVEKHFASEMLEIKKPTNVHVANVNRGRVTVQFTSLNSDEERVLSDNNFMNLVKYKCSLFKKGNEQESKEYSLDKKTDGSSAPTPDIIEAETTYGIRVKIVVGDRESEWSDEIAEFTTPEFKKCCVWKKCPDDVDEEMKYSVDENNPRIVTKINYDGLCTIIGNTRIPLNKVTQWSVEILKSENNGDGINIGIAPFDINQNSYYNEYGWYFHCYWSELFSGPPYKYSDRKYGPGQGGGGGYVHTGEYVGVVMDTTRGDLSFVLNGVNYGVAYEGIPLDKPLVPCVLLYYQGDSVELDL